MRTNKKVNTALFISTAHKYLLYFSIGTIPSREREKKGNYGAIIAPHLYAPVDSICILRSLRRALTTRRSFASRGNDVTDYLQRERDRRRGERERKRGRQRAFMHVQLVRTYVPTYVPRRSVRRLRNRLRPGTNMHKPTLVRVPSNGISA